MILVLAVACGVSVANIYFPQALSPLIARGLHVSPSSAALAATAAQLGYAAGIFLLVPLGDRLVHRRLIVALLVLTGLGLLAAGAAPTLPLLIGASALVGATTVVPQVIIPMAAGLVPAERRGAVTGTLLSGLIGGILLARTFGASVGTWWGWRAPYLVAAALVLPLALVLAFVVPRTTPPSRQRYPALLASSLRLLRAEPQLRRSGFYQAMVFAGFSAAWTSITLLVTGPTYGLGAQAVGLIALVGAGSMFCTPAAGRAVDRLGPDRVNLVCFLAAVAAAAVLAVGAHRGALGLTALVVGMLLLDTATQSGQVANQARIFALNAQARSRLNTAYMTCSFLGGSLGSWVGLRAYGALGWTGVCGLVGTTAVLALARHLLRSTTPPPPASAAPVEAVVLPTPDRASADPEASQPAAS
ncbi:MFS transporter [Kitasatospora kifunensis]|uniref:Putative MFS family arabinose efflux permease n=1 Tax=Kitasatospora kifunensis TaxID=58351 RepID=A0A7W7QWJ8_KITKI|nr:MFS transporter [Kitasatospora kifunensis]MBB4921093.1 putative MFS family arabinose efflux permease [Kitasatospora kifunensis]